LALALALGRQLTFTLLGSEFLIEATLTLLSHLGVGEFAVFRRPFLRDTFFCELALLQRRFLGKLLPRFPFEAALPIFTSLKEVLLQRRLSLLPIEEFFLGKFTLLPFGGVFVREGLAFLSLWKKLAVVKAALTLCPFRIVKRFLFEGGFLFNRLLFIECPLLDLLPFRTWLFFAFDIRFELLVVVVSETLVIALVPGKVVAHAGRAISCPPGGVKDSIGVARDGVVLEVILAILLIFIKRGVIAVPFWRWPFLFGVRFVRVAAWMGVFAIFRFFEFRISGKWRVLIFGFRLVTLVKGAVPIFLRASGVLSF
jgi:hypothetical protein